MTTPHQSSPAVPAEAEQVRGPGFAVPPGSALRAAAARLGVEKLNCKTCVHGYEDSDGEPGASYYCGMTCSKHDLPETYLEDNGVDIETEKSCWHPDFWKCETPEIMDMIDGTDASMKRAGKAWRKLIAEIHAEG